MIVWASIRFVFGQNLSFPKVKWIPDSEHPIRADIIEQSSAFPPCSGLHSAALGPETGVRVSLPDGVLSTVRSHIYPEVEFQDEVPPQWYATELSKSSSDHVRILKTPALSLSLKTPAFSGIFTSMKTSGFQWNSCKSIFRIPSPCRIFTKMPQKDFPDFTSMKDFHKVLQKDFPDFTTMKDFHQNAAKGFSGLPHHEGFSQNAGKGFSLFGGVCFSEKTKNYDTGTIEINFMGRHGRNVTER